MLENTDPNAETIWETIEGGKVSELTISYAVQGKQTIAILSVGNLILTLNAGQLQGQLQDYVAQMGSRVIRRFMSLLCQINRT